MELKGYTKLMKLISWNVNGIRACGKGGFVKWLAREKADFVCVQETKARPEQLDEELLHPAGYHSYWHSAEKAGYSGVAIFARKEPLSIRLGIGQPDIDSEGRVIVAELAGGIMLVNAYFPNSQRDHARLPYKLAFCDRMLKFCDQMRKKGKHVVLCGDFNIAHREIDLRNPKSNQDNAGFLPQERAWMDRFTEAGYVDTFRHFTPDPHHYTWWSYRPGVREKNIGWRLDYFCTGPETKDRLKSAAIQPDVRGSDHCPVSLVLKD
jgi:exodeoxyribonuclease III